MFPPPFLVVFLRFLVVVSHFGGDFAFWGVFSRYAAIISRCARFLGGFPPPQGRAQNVKFPLCEAEANDYNCGTVFFSLPYTTTHKQRPGYCITKNRLVLTSYSLDFTLLAVVLNRVGWCP